VTETAGPGIGDDRVQLAVFPGDLGEPLRQRIEVRQIDRDRLEAGPREGPVRKMRKMRKSRPMPMTRFPASNSLRLNACPMPRLAPVIRTRRRSGLLSRLDTRRSYRDDSLRAVSIFFPVYR